MTPSGTPAEAAAQAAEGTRVADERPSLVFALSDGLTGSGDAVLRGLQAAFGAEVPIVGGAAGDKRRLAHTVQLHARGVARDSVAVQALYGPVQISTGVESGWAPLGSRVRVDATAGNVVKRIDGKSAIEFYRHDMGEYLRGATMPAYPLGVWPAGGEPFYVRSPRGGLRRQLHDPQRDDGHPGRRRDARRARGAVPQRDLCHGGHR